MERIAAPSPHEQSRRWVLRDDNQQHHHGVVRSAHDVAIQLLWKSSRDGAELEVGYYRLHLPALCAGGFVRLEREDDPAAGVRVRFYRGPDGVVYLQTRQDQPRLPVGEIPRPV